MNNYVIESIIKSIKNCFLFQNKNLMLYVILNDSVVICRCVVANYMNCYTKAIEFQLQLQEML